VVSIALFLNQENRTKLKGGKCGQKAPSQYCYCSAVNLQTEIEASASLKFKAKHERK